MKTTENEKSSSWCRVGTNLIRFVRTGVYFAHARVGGKLIRKSLKTTKITVARMKLNDLLGAERRQTEARGALGDGKLTFSQALAKYRHRLEGDHALKPRTKVYRNERIAALLKSWPELNKMDVRNITKSNCLDWAAGFAKKYSGTNFNNTVGTLRQILDLAIEAGATYDNPARLIKRARIRAKELHLPSNEQFRAILTEIESVGVGSTRRCADLARFLAFGGFRLREAANITWGDCDFSKGEVHVRGDKETGPKNWTSRRVPMIPEMKELLERLRTQRTNAQPADPVMLVRECRGALYRACAKLGVPRLRHHDLRHLFITICIESNVDIPTIARWAGHKDGGALIMKVYGHLRNDHSTKMAQKALPRERPQMLRMRKPRRDIRTLQQIQ